MVIQSIRETSHTVLSQASLFTFVLIAVEMIKIWTPQKWLKLC